MLAALALDLVEDAVLLEELDVLLGGQDGQGIDGIAEVGELAFLLGFDVPGVVVAVAVEDHALVLLDRLLEKALDGGLQLGSRRVRADGLLELCREVIEAFGDNRVEDGRDRLAAAHGAELELIAGECERRGAVAVAGVAGELGQGAGAQVELAALHRALG